MKLAYSLLLSLLVVGPFANARKFSFKTEDVAAYFRGTGGLSALGQSAFKDSISSSTISFSSEAPTLNLGGELGMLVKFTEQVNLRIGAMVLQSKIGGIKGSSPSTSAEFFELESDIFVFNPQAVFEYTFKGTATSRFVLYAGLGYANVRLDNKYNINATGETELGVSSYTEKSEGNFISGVVGVGWEGLFVDNVTAFVDVGYRFLDANKMKHKTDEAVIGGNVTKGSELNNSNGQVRTLDLGGPFIGLAFRFYIDVI